MSLIDEKPVNPEGKEYFSGIIENIVYSNEENGYAILDFAIDTNEIVTVVGTLPYVFEGDSLTVYGKWVNNPKYGAQFKVEQYEKIMPADAVAILKYLSSGAVKGIGPKTAQRIVEQFGDETFDVMENHPDWLADINGISYKKAIDIAEDFKNKAGMRAAMMFFRNYFGTTMTVKIYQKWGGKAVDIAKHNPYRLCDEIDGIGFEKADEIARELGIESDSAERVMSGVRYVLNFNANQNGHTCLPYDRLVQASAMMLEVPESRVESAIEVLLKFEKIAYSIYDGEKYIFDKVLYDSEKYISEKLLSIDKNCINPDTSDILSYISKEESENGIKYAELQRQAIKEAMSNGFMILTGGPGTGKTTVVRALLKIFKGMGMKVALAAPTGRAAKRLSESTSSEAKTIHRMLEMSYESNDSVFLRDEKNYLDESVVIVDEISMADTPLFCALLKAIKPGARLIIIGDANQLPSVGAGNVLRDLIDCGRFATVELTEIFRQAKESLIITNAHKINSGEMPVLDVSNNDFFFLARKSDSEIANTVVDLCKNRLPKAYGAQIVNRIQVISPSRRGAGGVDNLNILLQNALNPSKTSNSYIHRTRTFKIGDKVMQTKNNYQIEWEKDSQKGCGVFNGDIGEITEINAR
ncbi:MAG: ATP-dependent RecD-like DNA helicase [Clostridia bacterium]|nr:ATP-dependent RecD-like DNA helicase [Clostridia bacterium]